MIVVKVLFVHASTCNSITFVISSLLVPFRIQAESDRGLNRSCCYSAHWTGPPQSGHSNQTIQTNCLKDSKYIFSVLFSLNTDYKY